MLFAGNCAAVVAAVTTALWAIHGRTASPQTFATAFAIAGYAISAAIAMRPANAAIDWHAARLLAALLLLYQACLWIAFRFGSPLVQAVVNCNILIIVACDAAAVSDVRAVDLQVAAAAVVQVAASAFLVLRVRSANETTLAQEDRPVTATISA